MMQRNAKILKTIQEMEMTSHGKKKNAREDLQTIMRKKQDSVKC